MPSEHPNPEALAVAHRGGGDPDRLQSSLPAEGRARLATDRAEGVVDV